MTEDIQQQILDELRNQTELFKKFNKRYSIASVSALVFVVILLGLTALIPHIQRSLSASGQPVDSWSAARNLIDQAEFSRSDAMLQRLEQRFPDYFYTYSVLAYSNLRRGNFKEAEANYAKAYDLFPTEENKKLLDAIRMVLERKNTTPNKSSPP